MLKIVANGKEYVLEDINQGTNLSTGIAKIQGKSKVKTLAPVDVEQYEKQLDFVQDVTSANRLEQMVTYMQTELQKPLEMSNMGTFLSLVFADIHKEEQDTIIANQFDARKLNGVIANVARPWYTNRINSEAGH